MTKYKRAFCIHCGKWKVPRGKGFCQKCYDIYKMATGQIMICNQCGQQAPATRTNRCKPCHRKNWNKNNLAHVNAYNRKWEKEHRDRHRANQRKYDNSPKGKATSYINVQRRLARKAKAPGRGLTTKQWNGVKDAYDHRCYYCLKVKKLTIDHVIPLARGGAHDIDNIVPACGFCNNSKGALTEEEFFQKRREGLLALP